MRFVVFYRNREDIKKAMKEQIVSLIKQGVNFTQNAVNSHLCACRPFWPTYDEINNLPMYIQVEEIEWDGANLILKRQLVIDVEAIEITPLTTE